MKLLGNRENAVFLAKMSLTPPIFYSITTTTSLPLTIAFFTRSKSWRKRSWLLITNPGA